MNCYQGWHVHKANEKCDRYEIRFKINMKVIVFKGINRCDGYRMRNANEGLGRYRHRFRDVSEE